MEENLKEIWISINQKNKRKFKRSIVLRYILNIFINVLLLLISWFIIIPDEHIEIFSLTLISCLSDIIIWGCVYFIFMFFNKSHLFKEFKQNMKIESLILWFLFIFFLVQLAAMAILTFLFTVDISNNKDNPLWLWFFIIFIMLRAFVRFQLLNSSNKKQRKNTLVLSSIILWNNLSFLKNDINIIDNKTHEFKPYNLKIRKISGSSFLDNLNSLGLSNIIALIINLGLLISKSITDDVSLLVWVCYEIVFINSILYWYLCSFNIKLWFYTPQENLNKILDEKNININLKNLKCINLEDSKNIEQIVILALSFFASYFDNNIKIKQNYIFDVQDFIYKNNKFLTIFSIPDKKEKNNISSLKIHILNDEKNLYINLNGTLKIDKF